MAQTTHPTTPEFTAADRLRKAREVTGLSQGDFADQLGVSKGTIVNYETRPDHPRRPLIVARWAQYTGVDAAWLDPDPAVIDLTEDLRSRWSSGGWAISAGLELVSAS